MWGRSTPPIFTEKFLKNRQLGQKLSLKCIFTETFLKSKSVVPLHQYIAQIFFRLAISYLYRNVGYGGAGVSPNGSDDIAHISFQIYLSWVILGEVRLVEYG